MAAQIGGGLFFPRRIHMESGSKELYIVLGVMGLLFVIACTAVVIFIRVWKKERGGKGR